MLTEEMKKKFNASQEKESVYNICEMNGTISRESEFDIVSFHFLLTSPNCSLSYAYHMQLISNSLS